MSLPTRLPGASHGSWRKQVTWSAMQSPEYLDLVQDEEDAMDAIVGASTDASDRTYRLAPRKGDDLVSKRAGFSLHAGRSVVNILVITLAPSPGVKLQCEENPHQNRWTGMRPRAESITLDVICVT